MKTLNTLKFLLLSLLFLLGAGCTQKMGDEGSIKPLDPIQDEISQARYLPQGVVSRTDFSDASPYYTGRKPGGNFSDFPFPVQEKQAEQGAQDYRVFCSVCHGEKGEGDGNVVKRGFTKPKPLGTGMPPGYLFDAMTLGSKDMDTFRDVLNEEERWAIVAYIKKALGKGQAR